MGLELKETMKCNNEKIGIWIIYIILDLFCVGIGMGVPFFNILFGSIVGWYIMSRYVKSVQEINKIMREIFYWSVMTSLFTFIVMAFIWGPTLRFLFDTKANLVNFGIPQILYTPKASFIGWWVLMIFISPFLQLLTTISGAFFTLLFKFRHTKK